MIGSILRNAAEIVYSYTGAGPAVLLIHGFPFDRTIWDAQATGLQDGYQVITPDLRGFGESTSMESPSDYYSMDALAEDLRAVLDDMGVTTAVVGGLSMGGYIALAFWRRYPELVRGLILANTRASADTEEGRANRRKQVMEAQARGRGVVFDQMLPKLLAPETLQSRPELVERVRAIMERSNLSGVVGALEGMATRPDARDLLPNITVPTLILHGQADQLIPPSEAEAMRAAIPNARLVLIPGAGHVTSMEQPEATNQAIRAFLDGIE